jgi:hypothetical protein
MSTVAAVVVVVDLWGVVGLCPLRLGDSGVAIHTKHHRSCQYPPGNSLCVCVFAYVLYLRVCGLVCVCESE